MKRMKKIISIIIVAMLIASMCVMGTISSGASGTGVGLAEWAMNAYNSGWTYVWGGASPGAVDCSGLIYSYCGGNRTSMLADAQANGRAWGYVSNGIPNVHGLGLSRPGHVGVYVGNGMEVDARGTGYNMCYQAVGGSWSCWFKLTAVSYPTTGWETFCGNNYYYENGEYITNTTRTIDGVTYTFGSDGIASGGTPASSADYSDESSSSSSSSSGSSTKKADDNGPLKNGSQGSRVEKLQTRLQELGYYNGLIDGDFGDLTEKAFKLFQKQAGLYVDGIAGSDADLLYSDDAPAYVAEKKKADTEVVREEEDEELADTGALLTDIEDEEEEVTEEETAPEEETVTTGYSFSLGDTDDKLIAIQERLIALGWLEDGQADGTFGEMTQAAVLQFQEANGLEATGVIDEATYQMLFSADAKRGANAPADTAKAEQNTLTKVAENKAANTAATAPHTAAAVKSNELSSKALAGVTESINLSRNAHTTNFQFIMWLAIMIVVMLISFGIVYAVEKKKRHTPVHSGRRYQ